MYMSIVTLKKKTNQSYKTMSTGHAQFSMNGTTRNQGWIGQSNLSRNLNDHLNDNTVVKSSVVNDSSAIKYRWIRRPFTVKNDPPSFIEKRKEEQNCPSNDVKGSLCSYIKDIGTMNQSDYINTKKCFLM